MQIIRNPRFLIGSAPPLLQPHPHLMEGLMRVWVVFACAYAGEVCDSANAVDAIWLLLGHRPATSTREHVY